ncbi:MAG: hypothetical protein V4515_04535 [Chloroflexota bacterium]
MTVSLLQSKTMSAGSGTNTLAATFDTAATAGNALLYCAALDKNAGVYTLAGFTQAVFLTSANVSLLIAWAPAAGGETVISGTWTGTNSGGSNGYLAEVQDPDSAGAWEEKATAGTSADGGGNVTTKTSGTSGTIAALATGGAMAFAAFGVDSVMTSPAPSYTNSYTGVRSMSSGVAEAGLWVAQLAIAAAGGTTSTTIDRDPTVTGTVTADQMAGGLIVLGRATAGAGTPAPAPEYRPVRRVRAALVR